MQLPQTKTIFSQRPYSPGVIDSLFQLAKGQAGPSGWILSADNDKSFLLLFILQNCPYAAAQLSDDSFKSLNLHDYFQMMASENRFRLTLHVTNPVLFKCLLVVVQKLPTTSGTTDLLNIEHLLKQIKSSKKEVVVSLRRLDELNVFYFMKGELQETFFANPDSVSKDGSSEDQFLEYAYSGSLSAPITVQAYYDVQVNPAKDSELIWQEWPGGIVEYFLRSRPELVFLSGGESVEKRVIAKSQFSLGRNPQSDLVINDTLASRDHAVIRETGGKFILEDRKSRNGTLVNGKKISTVTLADGDEIQIGDFRIMFVEKSKEPLKTTIVSEEVLDTTIVKMGDSVLQQAAAPKTAAAEKTAVMVLEMIEGKAPGTRYPLKNKAIIGRTKTNINTNDPKTSRHHALIERKEDGYHFTDLKSTNGSFINGQEVHTKLLTPGDIIKIGDSAFKVVEERP